jgi:ribulose-phosphate 3-epimerase
MARSIFNPICRVNAPFIKTPSLVYPTNKFRATNKRHGPIRPPRRSKPVRLAGDFSTPPAPAPCDTLPPVTVDMPQFHPQLAPSILSADFAHLAEGIAAVERGGATIIHCDVMDGHFVPNITIGPPVVKSLRKVTKLPLDCHLMIENPDEYIPAFADAGADWVSVHCEATRHLHRSLTLIAENGMQAGVVINPATPVNLLRDILPLVHHVLVMSVNPGFGGQLFIPHSLDKIRQLRELRAELGLAYHIEVDGGIHIHTIGPVVEAGADHIVAGYAVFGKGDPAENTRELLATARRAALPSA